MTSGEAEQRWSGPLSAVPTPVLYGGKKAVLLTLDIGGELSQVVIIGSINYRDAMRCRVGDFVQAWGNIYSGQLVSLQFTNHGQIEFSPGPDIEFLEFMYGELVGGAALEP